MYNTYKAPSHIHTFIPPSANPYFSKLINTIQYRFKMIWEFRSQLQKTIIQSSSISHSSPFTNYTTLIRQLFRSMFLVNTAAYSFSKTYSFFKLIIYRCIICKLFGRFVTSIQVLFRVLILPYAPDFNPIHGSFESPIKNSNQLLFHGEIGKYQFNFNI